MIKVIYPSGTTERRTIYIMLDLYDYENGKDISECRCYGFGWYGESLGEDKQLGIQCWTAPEAVDILYVPLKNYLDAAIKKSINEIPKQ